MTSVWMVTTGSYSDFRVVGVWASRELAERAKALIGDQDGEVEELQVQQSLDGLRREYSFRVPYQRRSGEPTVRPVMVGSPLDLQEPSLREHRGDRDRTYMGTDRDAVRALARAFAVELHGVALER